MRSTTGKIGLSGEKPLLGQQLYIYTKLPDFKLKTKNPPQRKYNKYNKVYKGIIVYIILYNMFIISLNLLIHASHAYKLCQLSSYSMLCIVTLYLYNFI